MYKFRKRRNRNMWTIQYAYAGRMSDAVIRLNEDKNSIYYGKYYIYCGAVLEMADTLEDAKRTALKLIK